jgi:uncharacterized membrane protein
VAVATYSDKASAEQDYHAIKGIKHEGELDHVAVTMVKKKSDGSLDIDRHDTSAKHMAWGGAALGGALTVIAAPLGIVFLGNLVATSAAWAGAGGLVGHFHKNIPKDVAREMGDLLEAGDFGLLVVAANPKGVDIGALLANADEKIVEDNVSDPDGALVAAFEQAEA